MPLQSLFDRSPVLPVDVTISLARYLHSIRATHKQALSSEHKGDLTRAALLQIRVLQLVCKTLPAHPDYALAENAPVLRELRAIAHTGFRDIDRLAIALDATPPPSTNAVLPPPASTPISEPPLAQPSPSDPSSLPVHVPAPPPRPPRHPIALSGALVDLFERIATDATRRSVSTVGVLAGRVVDDDDDRQKSDGEEEVAALIIPSQTNDTVWSVLRYEQDVAQLLTIKKLRTMGLVAITPRAGRPGLPDNAARRALAGIQQTFENGFALVIVRTGGSERYTRMGAVRLSESGMRRAVEEGEGEGDELDEDNDEVIEASDVEVREDGSPAFKLYDLRPLAVARDEQVNLEDGRRASRATTGAYGN